MCKRSNAFSRPVLMVRGLDGYFDLPLLAGAPRAPAGGHACSFQGPERALVSPPFGGDSEGATPLPIPNRAVKPLSADGTWASRPWESRSPPFFNRGAASEAALRRPGGIPRLPGRNVHSRNRSDRTRGDCPDRAGPGPARRPGAGPPPGRLVGGERAG